MTNFHKKIKKWKKTSKHYLTSGNTSYFNLANRFGTRLVTCPGSTQYFRAYITFCTAKCLMLWLVTVLCLFETFLFPLVFLYSTLFYPNTYIHLRVFLNIFFLPFLSLQILSDLTRFLKGIFNVDPSFCFCLFWQSARLFLSNQKHTLSFNSISPSHYHSSLFFSMFFSRSPI